MPQRRQYLPRQQTLPRRQVLPCRQEFPRGNPRLPGNPRIRPPGLRNQPSTVPTVPTGLPLAIPERMTTRLPRKGGYPQTRGGGLSLVPRIFRRHQHLPLGCQPRSLECSTRFSQSLYDLARLARTLYASQPDSPMLKWVLSAKTHFSPGQAKSRRSCASPDYITTRWNYSQQRDRTSICFYTHNTPSTVKSHYYINS